MSMSSALPDVHSPTVALTHPTTAEKELQFTRNSAEWRGALSTEAYLRREDHLSAQALTANAGITYWVLVDTIEPDVRRVLCGCESIRRRALVSRGGKVQDVVAHGIASVFCPVEHRGRGYAQRMMRELSTALRTHQSDETELKSLFSVLFSDIGKMFYAKQGWQAFPSSHIAVPAAKPTEYSAAVPTPTPLRAEDLPALCEVDEQQLRRKLAARSPDQPTAVALIPDVKAVSWLHARENFACTEMYGRIPEIKGAIVGNEHGRRVWCYWTRMYENPDKEATKGNVLHIVRLVIEDADSSEEVISKSTTAAGNLGKGDEGHVLAVEALFRAAQVQAAEWHMEEVQIWNPTPVTIAAAQRVEAEAQVVDRETGSIAALNWFGDQTEATGLQWVGNEKYGWC